MGYKKYWDKEIETMPINSLKKLQLKRLKEVVERAYHKSSFYKKLYDEAGFHPSKIKYLEDVTKIPMVDKKRVVPSYPFGLVTARKNKIAEVHAGTLPTMDILPVFATKKDLDTWGELNARSLWMVGLRPGDRIQNAYRFGLSTGGFGFHYGAHKVGMLSIPASTGRTEYQLKLILDMKVNAITMMPSYAVHMGLVAKELGYDMPSESHLKVGLFGAEPFSYTTRKNIERLFGIKAYDEYGMNEFLGPGMACECEERKGLHVWADCFLLECINPKTNEWVEEGEEGELVWTWLSSEGTAMIRYRSHDVTFVTWNKCKCGRTHPKFSAQITRSDYALCIGGYIVYPEKLYDLLKTISDIGFYQVVIETYKALDSLILKIEVIDIDILKNKFRSQKLKADIISKTSSYLGIRPKVELYEPMSLSSRLKEKKIPYIVLDYRSSTGKYGLAAEERWSKLR